MSDKYHLDPGGMWQGIMYNLTHFKVLIKNIMYHSVIKTDSMVEGLLNIPLYKTGIYESLYVAYFKVIALFGMINPKLQSSTQGCSLKLRPNGVSDSILLILQCTRLKTDAC